MSDVIIYEPTFLNHYVIDSNPFRVCLDYIDGTSITNKKIGFYLYYYNNNLEVSYMLKNGFWCQDISSRGESLFATIDEAVETLNKYYNVLDLDLGVLE